MPRRKIVKIDEELCDGCGLCVPACAEGALQIIDGKARLVGEFYCDGLGACLGECPRGAISIEERDVSDFDQQDLLKRRREEQKAEDKQHVAVKQPGDRPAIFGGTDPQEAEKLPCGCPGSALRTRNSGHSAEVNASLAKETPAEPSSLKHWPVQLRLVPPEAPFLQNADILICADCVPFAVPDFHRRFLRDRVVLVGCPKLDDLDYYRRKLNDIFRTTRPRRVVVLRMEVPCCAGLAQAAIEARHLAAPDAPLEVHTLGIFGGVSVKTYPPRQKLYEAL